MSISSPLEFPYLKLYPKFWSNFWLYFPEKFYVRGESSKKHPEFTTRYRRIKAHRGHKKAIIAICRMILTAIWHILSDLKPYTSEGFLESRPVNKSKILTTSQALNLLKQRGYIIKDDVVPVT